MDRLRKRADFKTVAGGKRVARRAFVIQARPRRGARDDGSPPPQPRFGFTVTKKIGNAVVRNRIRRRLKEAVRLIGPDHAAAGTDYVLIGRRNALNEPFERLLVDLASSLDALASRDRTDDSVAAAANE
jgi:ribonuclease P protein component